MGRIGKPFVLVLVANFEKRPVFSLFFVSVKSVGFSGKYGKDASEKHCLFFPQFEIYLFTTVNFFVFQVEWRDEEN